MKLPLPAILGVVLASVLPTAAPAQAPPTHSAFQLRFGGFFPSGGGEVWDENEQVFTLDPSDFNDFAFGMSFVLSMNNHVELGFNADFYDAAARSQYRDWVDELGAAIFHDTRLELMPLSMDVRFLPGGRFNYAGSAGQRRLLKPVPYIGAGVGMTFWEYEEVGDFLDFSFDPPEIFPGAFHDDGVTLTVHAIAGLELPVNPVMSVQFEGRYLWVEEELGGDFSGLGELNLSGFFLYAGFSFRF